MKNGMVCKTQDVIARGKRYIVQKTSSSCQHHGGRNFSLGFLWKKLHSDRKYFFHIVFSHGSGYSTCHQHANNVAWMYHFFAHAPGKCNNDYTQHHSYNGSRTVDTLQACSKRNDHATRQASSDSRNTISNICLKIATDPRNIFNKNIAQSKRKQWQEIRIGLGSIFLAPFLYSFTGLRGYKDLYNIFPHLPLFLFM